MKKATIFLGALLCAITGWAATYNGTLTVTVNDFTGSQDNIPIVIEQNEDGTYNLSLKNFILVQGEDVIGIGNIELNNVPGTTDEESGYTEIAVNQDIQISEGDEDIDVPLWMGPNLGDVPIVLQAKFNNDELFVPIDIDMMDSLEQIIVVDFYGKGEGGSTITGDLNGDGVVDVSDVNIMIDMVLGKQAPTAAADLNGDNTVDVSDVNALIDIVLGK